MAPGFHPSAKRRRGRTAWRMGIHPGPTFGFAFLDVKIQLLDKRCGPDLVIVPTGVD